MSTTPANIAPLPANFPKEYVTADGTFDLAAFTTLLRETWMHYYSYDDDISGWDDSKVAPVAAHFQNSLLNISEPFNHGWVDNALHEAMLDLHGKSAYRLDFDTIISIADDLTRGIRDA